MLLLRGILRAATQLGGTTNRKTGELIPLRDVLQVETTDNRGLVEVTTITVPDHKLYLEKVNQLVQLPVRAWAPNGAKVGFVFEPAEGAA